MKNKLFCAFIAAVILTAFSSLAAADLPNHQMQGMWLINLTSAGPAIFALKVNIEMITWSFGRDVSGYTWSSVVYYAIFNRVRIAVTQADSFRLVFNGTRLGKYIIGTAYVVDLGLDIPGDVLIGPANAVWSGPLL